MHTETTTCRRCGRTLRASAAQGIGPVCARRERAEKAVADVKAATVAKAHEDIADGALVNTRRTTSAGNSIYAVVSTDGTHTYLATAKSCTCRAGHCGRTCHHAVAVRILAA